MASRWDELIAEYDNMGTWEGQAQFITDRTGLSDECIRRILVPLIIQPAFGKEGDVEAQARNAGLSFDEYAVALVPLLRMSVERAEARLREITARIDYRDDPAFSDNERERIRKWEAFVGTIARLSGEKTEVVNQIWDAVVAFITREQEILQELLRLNSSEKGPSEETVSNDHDSSCFKRP